MIALLERFGDRSPNRIQVHIGRTDQQRSFVNDPRGMETVLEKMSKDPDYIQDIIDPDDFNLASGGIAGQLHLNQGGRIRYAKGKTEKEKWKETLKFLE